MEICSFWCGSLSPQLPDSACFSVSAACFSLAGHMIRRSGQFLSSSPYPRVHPRRSLFPREVSGSLYPRSLPAHSFYSFLAPCLSEPSEPHGQDQHEAVRAPTPPIPPCRRGSAMPSTVGSGAPGVPCYTMRPGWGVLAAHVSWRFADALYSLQG